MLNKSGKGGHPCLVPDLRGEALSCFPLSMMFTVGFPFKPLFLRYVPSKPMLLRVFISLYIVKCLFCICGNDHIPFILFLIDVICLFFPPSGRPTTLYELMRKADRWLIRTYWDLEFPRPLLPHFDFVGGLHCKPAKPLPKVTDSCFFCFVSSCHFISIVA